MLIDAAKGVEPQTKKLFAICAERGIPLFTFMNKLDRPSRDPLELLDELERVFGIGVFPVNWPLGSGDNFRGVYDRRTKAVHLFERAAHGATRAAVEVTDARDPQLRELVDADTYAQFCDAIDLLDGAGESFDAEAVAHGKVTPVFFGSAVTNFGVQLFLDDFIGMAPPPAPRGAIDPNDANFTGFVFKIQANMDPRHRDRVAFVRVCSGEFARDMTVRNARTDSTVRLSRAMRFSPAIGNRSTPHMRAMSSASSTPAPSPSAIRSSKGSRSAFRPFRRSLRNISFHCGVWTPRVTNRLAKASRSCGKREPFKCSIPGEIRASNRSWARSANCRCKSRRTAWNRSTTSRLRSPGFPYTLALYVEGDRERLKTAHLPTNAKLVEDYTGRPVALFESEWSVRLAREWNPQLRFEPFGMQHDAEALAS